MNDARDWRHRRANTGRNPLSENVPETPGPVDLPTEAGDGDPLDLSQVAFDDQFLDALSRDVPVTTRDDGEYQLAALLSEWRHGVVDSPAPDLPSVGEVEHAIAATERASRGKRIVRHLRVVSGAAAIIVVAAAGLTVLSEGSQPGDPLWPVKQVVFAQAASETQAAHDVRTNLEQAEEAMSTGDTKAAASLISKAESEMGPVRDGDTRTQMNDWIARLRQGAGTTTNRSTLPSSSDRSTQSTLTSTETSSADPRLRTQTSQTAPEPSDPNTPRTTDSQTTGPSSPTNQLAPTTQTTTTTVPSTTASYTVTIPPAGPQPPNPPAIDDRGAEATTTTTTTMPPR